MPRRLVERIRDQRGFSLIELLVVILLLGILAAIALPMFLGQGDKASDADAKSNARNLASQVESCFTPSEDFRDCDSQAKLGEFAAGIDYGSNPGQVEVENATQTSYQVVAVSKSQSNGQYHTFTITRSTAGTNDRTCTAGSSGTGGGCTNGTW